MKVRKVFKQVLKEKKQEEKQQEHLLQTNIKRLKKSVERNKNRQHATEALKKMVLKQNGESTSSGPVSGEPRDDDDA
jgi:fatty acid/phospholipid biosynthesis enzyme